MSPAIKSLLARLVRPLQSRKTRIALATLIGAYLADWGLEVSDVTLLGILGLGAAWIHAIATEDAGEKSRMRVELSEPLAAEVTEREHGKG